MRMNFVVVVAMAAAGPAVAQTKLDRVVAVVDDAVILQSELDARVSPASAQLQSIVDPVERGRRRAQLVAQTLGELVDEELIAQAAVGARVDVSDAEVKAAIDEIKHQNSLDDRGLARELETQGYALDAYKRELRRQLARLRTISQLVTPRVQITDQDVRTRYDELQRRSTTALAPYDQLKDQLTTELRRRELDKLTTQWVDELRRKAHVVIKQT
jgi:peptidyl-prolyl cis-trans isomerase SurA